MEKEIDLEAGVILSEGLRGTDTISGATLARTFLFCKGFDNAERTIKVEVGLCLSDTNAASAEKVKSPLDVKTEGEEAANVAESQVGKEKRKVSSAKKSSKPPRPPQGLILYASDHKLVKEIAELAILKKARKERMKALKKLKAAKAAASGLSSSGSTFSMLFSIVFFLVILFQVVYSA